MVVDDFMLHVCICVVYPVPHLFNGQFPGNLAKPVPEGQIIVDFAECKRQWRWQ